jgi:hypothetical protein
MECSISLPCDKLRIAGTSLFAYRSDPRSRASVFERWVSGTAQWWVDGGVSLQR